MPLEFNFSNEFQLYHMNSTQLNFAIYKHFWYESTTLPLELNFAAKDQIYHKNSTQLNFAI